MKQEYEWNDLDVEEKFNIILKKLFWITPLIVISLIILFGSWYTINAGYRGVVLTMGSPSMTASTEGFHLKIPLIQHIEEMEVRTQKYEIDASAASSDLQDVATKIAVNYHLNPESVPKLYRDLGRYYQDNVIAPLVQETVKANTAKYSAEQLITQRASVKMDIENNLKQALLERGIYVEAVSITNFQFSPEFTKAIEAKVTAEQLKLKADRDLERITVEAQQKIETAKAEAESLRLQRLEITPELVNLRQIEAQRLAIEKWNGILPTVTGGTIPFINVK